MDRRRSLFEAAWTGDLTVLKRLVKEDPRILHSPSLLGGDNPLHIGCMASHYDFVKELIILNSKFAYDLNEDGLSPLHIAAANGDFNIVKELLVANNMVELCEVEGKNMYIPLHCAVIKGRWKVVNLLIETNPESIEKFTAQGETVLHLAIRNNQFKTLQILLDHLSRMGKLNLLKNKDDQGNTILNLATSKKLHHQVLSLLEENLINNDEEDILSQNDHNQAMGPQNGNSSGNESRHVVWALPNHGSDKRKYYDNGDVRNYILVVAALIVAATYQAILNPPGETWKWKGRRDHIFFSFRNSHFSGEMLLYGSFFIFNSWGFSASIYVMWLSMSRIPTFRILKLALVFLLISYQTSIALSISGKFHIFETPKNDPTFKGQVVWIICLTIWPILIIPAIGFLNKMFVRFS
ncbi:ankyrin repeat-containing protein BDA1-like [Impatiens glandulifera]|uniref:ankyrin repeat-containing protein BDA1-like n=1 Tax=Impatiens glandulifera TaxID=253017 RepID=UPI001FB18DD7|nr:ankyrin repeat-containing protein BDA1-like [Impatiens glandulifera]